MSAHTPGPWRVEVVPFIGNGRRIEVHDDSREVWVRLMSHASGPYGDGSRARRMANAALIAAAPDLLEALRVLVEVASVCIPNTAGHELEQARAAIAKAEGK